MAQSGHNRTLEVRPGFREEVRLGQPAYGDEPEPRAGSTRPRVARHIEIQMAAARQKRYAPRLRDRHHRWRTAMIDDASPCRLALLITTAYCPGEQSMR